MAKAWNGAGGKIVDSRRQWAGSVSASVYHSIDSQVFLGENILFNAFRDKFIECSQIYWLKSKRIQMKAKHHSILSFKMLINEFKVYTESY